MRRLLALLLLVLALASPAFAQPLVDRVPADALVYIGWRGTDTLGPAYDNSHLAAVVKASKLNEIVEQTIPQLLAKLAQDKPEVLAVQQATLPLLKHFLKRPTALYVAPGRDRRGRFEPQVGIICDAGDVAAEFHKGLVGLIDSAKKSSVKVAREGNFVILTIDQPDAAAALKPQTLLRDAPAFMSSMKQVDAEPVYAAFINVEQIVSEMDKDAQREKKPEAAKEWSAKRDALGLSGLKRVVVTGAFAGKDWSSQAFVEAPAPRRGLLALLGEQGVRDSAVKLIPKTASYAMVRQFDLGKLLAQIRQGIVTADPNAATKFDQGLAKVSAAVGTDVQQMLNAFGDQWVMYTDAGVGGAGAEGLVIVNELDEPAKAEAGLSAVIASAVRFGANVPNPQFAFTAGESQIDDMKVHHVTTPRGAAYWLVKNGKLYVAFSSEAAAAATLVGTPAVAAGSIFDNDKFKALRLRLGATRISGFTFADLPQSAPAAYGNIQAVLAVAGMLGASQGVWVPPNLLPPLDVLQQHLSPAASLTWVDATGWHSRGLSPFPGGSIFASQQVDVAAVGGTALGVSILLPSLNRARETANRVKCASNMRQIGQAILLYSNDNRGKYPDTAGELLKTQDITIEVFTCPSGDIEPSEELMRGGVDKLAAWVDAGESPYIYVGKGLTNASPADTLVLYEREEDHDEDGMNMLFADGHVEWNSLEIASEMIAAKSGKLPHRDQPRNAP